MSAPRFEDFLPGGSRSVVGGAPSKFEDFGTGRNLASTENSWNTPFMQTFQTQYRQAMSDGSADRYFLNRRTGIAMVNQSGKDDAGMDQAVRAGDVFNDGKLVGNIYDAYGEQRAEEILRPLLVKGDEQLRGVTVKQKQAEVQRDVDARGSRNAFDAEVKQVKDEWGGAADIAAPVAGGVGGAAVGAGAGAAIGAFFGGVGAVPGAAIGAVLGGLGFGAIGAAAASANRDELEDMAARGEAQARMLDRERTPGATGAAGAVRLQTTAQLAGEALNPLKQVVHGAADAQYGTQGDNKSGFYATDSKGNLQRGWEYTAADLAAGLAGGALQFASPVGGGLYAATMVGQIAGKTGTMALSGGRTFDERAGEFDNVFTSEDGSLNIASGLAGIGDIGIDVVQLGLARGLTRYRPASWGPTNSVDELAGFRFTLNEAGKATGARLTMSALAPSEMVQAMAVRSSALLTKKGSGGLTSDDMYRAAQNLVNSSTLRKATLLNGFGEATEEGLQTAFEAISHEQNFTLEEIAQASIQGGMMGAGMTIGSRIGARSADRRMFDKASTTAEAFGGLPMTYEQWRGLSPEEKATLAAVPDQQAYALQKTADRVAERMITDFVGGEVAAERLSDAQHAQIARERTNLNDVADGTYVISKAQHNISDHEVQTSISTVVDLLQRNTLGIAEQVAEAPGDPRMQRLQAHAADILAIAQEAEAEFYDENTSEARRSLIIQELNAELEARYRINPADTDSIDRAKAVTLTFLRNPADNAGSFQGLLPKASLQNSRDRADGFLQVSLGPTQAMGGDFDGDKITLTTRVELDDAVFKAMRTGRHLLGTLNNGGVNVMKRVFEMQEIELVGEALSSPNQAHRANAEALVTEIETFLTQTLRVGNNPFAEKVVQTFVRELRAGDRNAKAHLLDTLARDWPAEMRELSEETWTNPWFAINSFIHQRLQNFQFSQAASIRATAKRSLASPIRPDSKIGKVIAAAAASFTQNLSLTVLGSDIFRKWQSLHYSQYNSAELKASVEDAGTFQEMVAVLEALSSGKSESDFTALFTKDRITARVARQLETLATSASADFNGRKAAIPLLAQLTVPDLQKGRFHGKTTLVQWLLREAVDAEESRLRSMGVLDKDTGAQAKFARMRGANAGEAFLEVFGSYTFYDLLGSDADVFGSNLTLDQWTKSYADQDDFNRRETTKQLKLHASYKAMTREQGRHNLPYYVEDLEGANAITPYQGMVDALLQAGNNVISWNNDKRTVGGRIGKQSNRTSEAFRSALEQLNIAARAMGLDTTNPEAWRALLDKRPDLGRAFFAMISDEAVDTVLHADANGKVYAARWVHQMLTMPPAEAEMEFFRQTLLATWRSSGATAEDDGESRSYYRLNDRMHQLMYRLAKDGRTFQQQRFQEALFSLKDVNEFIAWVNTEVRGNEAPYTAWNRDVSELDTTATQGGWQQMLAGATQREAIAEFKKKAEALTADVDVELQREQIDDALHVQLMHAVSNPNSEAASLLKNLGRRLALAKKFRATLGPAAMQRSNIGALLGAMGHTTDKGQSATMFEVNGVYDAKGTSLKFGTGEEIAWSSLTANSVDEASADPTLLAADDFTLLAADGSVVDWQGLTPERFVELWGDRSNRPLLRAIVFPSAYEHTMDGRLDQVSLLDLSLAALVKGDELHDLLYGGGQHAKSVYLSMIEGVAGDQAVQRYVNEVVISQLGGRTNMLQDPREAEYRVQQAYQTLAEVLRALGEMAQVKVSTKAGVFNQVDILREQLRVRLHRELNTKNRGLFGEQLHSAVELFKRDLETRGSTPITMAEAKAFQARIASLDHLVETQNVQQMALAYGLPVKDKKVSEKDWADANKQRLIELVKYVRSGTGIQAMARWAAGLEKIQKMALDGKSVNQLPKLSYAEWQEVSQAIIANELQLAVSTTSPGLENVRIGKPEQEDWLKLHSPTFDYLLDDLLDSDSPLVKAAVELHKDFFRPDKGDMLPGDLADKLMTSLFDPKKLGQWDDRIAEQIQQASDRIDSSGTPEGISQGGMGPQRETTEGLATKRTFTKPLDTMFSLTTFSLEDLQNSAPLLVDRPKRPGQPMQSSALDGRFVKSVTLIAPDGTKIDLLRDGRPRPGLVFDEPAVSGLQSVTARRIEASVTAWRESSSMKTFPEDAFEVSVEFLHPADQPEGPEWANNVYFEGTVLDNDGDTFLSLDAAWWFAPGGIDPESSAQALGASKKKKKALKQVERISSARKRQLEAGWEIDFYAMLERKTAQLMSIDLGDSRRIHPSFRNAAFKKLKMRHLIRGLDADGQIAVLTAEQVIARQQAGAPLGLTNPELYVLSDSALRTMLGETGTQGELRILEAAPETDLALMRPWRGIIEPENLRLLPGMATLGSIDLFTTTAANRRSPRKLSGMAGLDDATRNAYQRDMIVMQQVASEVGVARMQSEQPAMYIDARTRAFEHATNSIGGRVHLDMARVQAGLPRTPDLETYNKFVDTLLINNFSDQLDRQGGATGFIYRFELPKSGTIPAFGELFGDAGLTRGEKQAGWTAAGDFVSIDLDSAAKASDAQIEKALRWFTAAGAVIALSSSTNSRQKSFASSLMRELGYKRVEGSDTIFTRRDPGDTPATVQARYDSLMATEGVETAGLIAMAQTRHFGLEENAGFLTEHAKNKRMLGAVDLIPNMAWPNFGLPLPSDMAVVRARLTDEALPALIAQSELAAGRPLTDAERTALEVAVHKAADGLNDRGLYNKGTELEIGDLIPLYYRATGQLILMRHGHRPPRNEGELEAQFAHGNTAIYGPTMLPAATTHSGTIIRFERAGKYGLRALLKIDMQALADKTVVQGSGFKALSIAAFDEYEPAKNLKVPTGITGWELSHIVGLSDSISKENYVGRVDNFNDAITYLGFDFRPVFAEVFFGKGFTDAQLSTVPQVLGELKRSLPKLSVPEVDRLMRAQNIASVYREAFTSLNLDDLGVRAEWVADVLAGNTPQNRIALAGVLYLMTDGAKPEHIMYSSGVGHPEAQAEGRYTRQMPKLFTNVFDRTSVKDPVRTYLVGMLNKRFDNPGAPHGWSMDNNFVVTFHNPVPEHTFQGYLQFASTGTSGDNPVINLMAQNRQATQTASLQQAAMARLAINARTATTKKLVKTAKRIEAQRENKAFSGIELLQLLNAVPNEEFVRVQQMQTAAEREYDQIGRIVVESLRQPIDLEADGWTDKTRSDFLNARARLAAKAGLHEYPQLIDYWIRYHYYTRVDAESVEEGGNPGLVSPVKALEGIGRMERNLADDLFPTADGMVPMMHPVDLQLMHRAALAGGPFQLKDANGNTLTGWDDWVRVALALGDPAQEGFDQLALTAVDGTFHLYRDLNLGLHGLSSSLYRERADLLLDPATQELMASVSPDRAKMLSKTEIVAANSTLEDLFGGRREGLSWRGKEPAGTAMGQTLRKKWAWMAEEGMPRPVGHTTRDLLMYGTRLETDGTVQNGFLRSLLNLRAGLALLNPMLTIGAPVEQFIQGSLLDVTQLLSGDAVTSRLPGSSIETAEQARDLRVKIDALAHNQKMKTLLFGEFAMEDQLHNAGWFERMTHKMAKLGGKIQDPTYKMRANTITRRYVEAAILAFRSTGTLTNITSVEVVDHLNSDVNWIQRNHPAIHQMAANTVREMKNMKDTSLSLALRGIIDPLATSSNLLVSTTSVLTLKLPFMFFGYSANKAVQLLGLQGVDAAVALMLHGRAKGPGSFVGHLQAAVSGKPYTEADGIIDMSSVIESLDLSNAFIKSGVTHTSLMALGLLAGNLGLSGEDEEDRRRRKAAKAQGFAYLYDPRDLVNDFRNADALYLDWLPFGWDMPFRVVNEKDPNGARSMVQLNWIMRQVFSPMIGMERFFNTGNPWEIWHGFEDAFYSFPLVNTTFINDAQSVFMELAESALQAEAEGTPESMPKAFNYWVQSVANLERMLMESSFVNMIYQASDKYDRDAWVMPERAADGQVVTNRLGVPERTGALREFKKDDGTIGTGYVGRSWEEATLAGYAENRLTLALLGSLVSLPSGNGSMLRGDMAVKTRSIKKDMLTVEEAQAFVEGMYAGTIKPGDPRLESIYISLPMRQQIESNLKKALVESGLKKFDGDQRKAEQYMWAVWKGDPQNPTITAMKDVVYSTYKFDKAISYRESSRYYQLNTTYVMGPDGRPWATGIDKHSLLNAAGMAPLQRYINTEDGSQGTDGQLNVTDKVRGINTGLRGIVAVPENASVPEEEAAKAAAAASTNAANNGYNGYSGNGWVDYGSSGSGWRNFGRSGGSGWSGGSGGSGGSTRLNAPQDQQAPYANDVQNVNVSTPLLRRYSIRRERIDSQKGRLKPWQ